MNHRRIPVLETMICLLVLASGAVTRVQASTLSTDVIGLFPQNIGEFAYADLKQARSLSWFPQLKQQLLPARFKPRLRPRRLKVHPPRSRKASLRPGANKCSAWRSVRFAPTRLKSISPRRSSR